MCSGCLPRDDCPPTRSEVDKEYKLLELTIAFVNGWYARKYQTVDVILGKSTIFGERKALTPSAVTFIKNHVGYWLTVFFDETIKSTEWTHIVDTKEVKKTSLLSKTTASNA
ncbi:hypothetical protein TKK_0018165 [Trichogramma kaykai]|uniref:Uncharacterized protein n=1 Tax=Trichogramma kaykai TaxID=54128 RepID=A0ABD2W0Z3_9HYME